MPTVAVVGPYRFFFYSSDRLEPRHVHVKRERSSAKYWLAPVRLDRSKGFSDHELLSIQRIVEQRQAQFLEAWNDHFGA